MQASPQGFTAEQEDTTRRPVINTQISWKKDYLSTINLFTIGVSLIGGNDIIPSQVGADSAWNYYQYTDESDYIIDASWERKLNMPLGGVSKALADVTLDNTSHRFTPKYMGGMSAINTSILPRRPINITAGFNYNGIDQTIPQFIGVFRRSPKVDVRRGTVEIQAVDFIDFLANKKVDETTMFTGLRTDQALENVFAELGYSTSQYELDQGRNTIGFGIFEKGLTWLNYVNGMVEAENGHLYQDENGVIRFENRVHWDSAPHNVVSRVISTSEVLESYAPDEDHIINLVEVIANPRAKQPNQLVYQLGIAVELPALSDTTIFVDFDDPMLQVDTPDWVANTLEDASGTDATTDVTLKNSDIFAQAAKYIFTNNSASTLYMTDMTVRGRPAKVVSQIYEREKIDSSITAYEERSVQINNDYIQDSDWASTYAQSLLLDYSRPESLITIVIKAQPDLQFGDMISWQGQNYNIYGIKTHIDPQVGFIQELDLLQSAGLDYFTIGSSTIGSGDVIAP